VEGRPKALYYQRRIRYLRASHRKSTGRESPKLFHDGMPYVITFFTIPFVSDSVLLLLISSNHINLDFLGAV
jgi:hypothetical protein